VVAYCQPWLSKHHLNPTTASGRRCEQAAVWGVRRYVAGLFESGIKAVNQLTFIVDARGSEHFWLVRASLLFWVDWNKIASAPFDLGRESAVSGMRQVPETVKRDLYLGLAVTSLYTLTAMGLIIAFG
jgi:hypothetical protein